MPSINSKPTTLRLASDEQTWREMDQTITDCVSQVCGHYDEATVRDFMFLVDILTNTEIDRVDRDCASLTVQKLAFAHSPRFERAMEEYLNEINPGRVQRRRKGAA